MFGISYCIWCVFLDLWGYIEAEPMQILTEDVWECSIVIGNENKFECVFMGHGVYIRDGPSTVSVQCISVMRWISAAIIHEDVPNQIMYVFFLREQLSSFNFCSRSGTCVRSDLPWKLCYVIDVYLNITVDLFQQMRATWNYRKKVING